MRNKQDFGFGVAENKTQFFAPVYRHDGVNDQAADGSGDCERYRLGNIGELESQGCAGFNTQLLNGLCQLIGLLPRIAIRQANA